MPSTTLAGYPKKQKLDPPSEAFLNAVRGAGSIVIDCELCGRTHFGNGDGDYEEGEYEKLLAKAAEQPDKYIQHHDNDMVSYGYVQGRQAVLDCPCNELTRYEIFIWNHRYMIAQYYRTRLNQAVQEVEDNIDRCQLPAELLPEPIEKPKRRFNHA